MWYKFQEGNPLGVSRVKKYQVAFYDMDRNGDCFDETFYSPDKIDKAMPFVETAEDSTNNDRTRVFVHFDDGDMYELKLEKLNKEHKYSNFFDK